MTRKSNEFKPELINCGNCVFFAEEYGKCTKLAYGNEPLEVTPEDGCTFGKERQASGVNAEATEGGRGQ